MASNADIRRLVLNDDRLSTLILTFDHTLNIPQLQYALSLNGTVKEIVVYTDETFLPRFPATEIRGLFEVLGGIPSLQRLCFNSRSGFDGVISVQALIYVLSRSTRLASFAVSDLKLEGSEFKGRNLKVTAKRVNQPGMGASAPRGGGRGFHRGGGGGFHRGGGGGFRGGGGRGRGRGGFRGGGGRGGHHPYY